MVVLGLIGGFDVGLLSFLFGFGLLGGGGPDLQRSWVPPMMVAMAVLWWFVVGFVGDGFVVVICSF